MKNINVLLILASVCALTAVPIQAAQEAHVGEEHEAHGEAEAHEEQGEAEEHAGHAEEEPAHVEISASMVEQTGIKSKIAESGALERTLVSYGRLALDPDNVVHIRARFPGQVIEVNVGLGETVNTGDPLATIESNDSLQPYTLKAPMAGTVLERHANQGGLATGQSLFTIASLNPLLAELKIFPGQRREVRAGQSVLIDAGDSQIEGRIRDILPQNTDSPFVIARVAIDNSEGLLSPGRLVTAHILVARIEAPLVIENQALQSVGNSPVVFIHKGDVFEPRPVELGHTDGQLTEVLSGLRAGERYVVENSYLIKADLEKSGAAHAH